MANLPMPPIRNSIARTMYSKLLEDMHDSSQSHSCWYSINTEQINTEERKFFIQFDEDEETKEFLENCRKKSDWIVTQLFHSMVKFFLTYFMTSTSVNGLLNRGSMFVLSSTQFQQLLNLENGSKMGSLLDLGAGDGAVTEKFSRFFSDVHVTEMSSTMERRLRTRGYTVLDVDKWHETDERYDVIACLNLLDRCDRPLDILDTLHRKLKPGSGRLLLAIVLPFYQYIESGTGDHSPKQQLNINGKTFEQQLSSLVNDVLRPAGYVLERFSKVPYLCEGDIYHSYYVLIDAVLVLKSVRN